VADRGTQDSDSQGPDSQGSDSQGRDEPRLDYHDPTSGIGGAAPAASALTLRAWLAAGALVCCIAGIIATAAVGGPLALTILLIVVAVTALADSVVIVTRRHRG